MIDQIIVYLYTLQMLILSSHSHW